jgi:hypothetical protein
MTAITDAAAWSSRRLSEHLHGLGYRVGKSSINLHRAKQCACYAVAARPDAVSSPVAGKGSIDITSAGAQVNNVVVESPINRDWSAIFALFNLDAAEFVVVDDTVRMSTWQQSARTKDGDRDSIQLYSYSARFARKASNALSDADVDERRARVQAWQLPRRTPGCGLGPPVAVVANLADIQGGKSEGGGVKATTDRLLNSLENLQAYVDKQRRIGVNLQEIVLANNGDPYENCAGNYAAQMFTVELNHRGQMNFVLDMWETYARTMFPQFDRAQWVSVLCNHTEMGRLGAGKNQTSDSDSGGAFLSESLRRVLAGRPEFDHVEWTIPHDEMVVYPTVAGVPMGFTHGHKIPGNDAAGFEKWLNGQVRGDTRAQAARVWVTAHRHHYAAWDMGSTFVFQCPSLDGGSKWLRDMTGRFSRSGMLAILVGVHDPLGFSDAAVL